MTPSARAHALLLTTVIFGGFSPILARLAQQEGLPTPVIVLIRLTVGSLFLAVLLYVRSELTIPKLRLRHYVLIVAAGILQALHFLGAYSALEYTTVLIANMTLATSPLMVIIWEIIFLQMIPKRTLRWGLILALMGGMLIALGKANSGGLGSDPYWGALLALAGAAAISLYLFIGRVVRPHVPVFSYVWMVYSIAALTMGGIVVTLQMPVSGYSTNGYVWTLLLTVIAQIFAQSAINYALGVFSATHVGIALRAVNVMGIVYAVFVFGELPGPIQVLGGAAIIGGVLVTSLGKTEDA